jgi:hypothetical protein
LWLLLLLLFYNLILMMNFFCLFYKIYFIFLLFKKVLFNFFSCSCLLVINNPPLPSLLNQIENKNKKISSRHANKTTIWLSEWMECRKRMIFWHSELLLCRHIKKTLFSLFMLFLFGSHELTFTLIHRHSQHCSYVKLHIQLILPKIYIKPHCRLHQQRMVRRKISWQKWKLPNYEIIVDFRV